MSFLDSLIPWKKPIEAATETVQNTVKVGMSMWDNKNFTAQETAATLLKLLEATKNQATSISRRHLLWAVIGMNSFTLIIAILYNSLGWTDRLEGLVQIMEVWKLGYAFAGAIAFYFLTQFTGGKR